MLQVHYENRRPVRRYLSSPLIYPFLRVSHIGTKGDIRTIERTAEAFDDCFIFSPIGRLVKIPHHLALHIYGLGNKARTEMGNRDNTSEKEKGKTSRMIADVTRRFAKLPLYRLKLQNVEARLGVALASSRSTRRDTDRIGDE
uniref:Uncharacterized protein n=1 Tax=Solanum tuberosum TaxID=4113 RepID=M1D862_SOLTU